MANGLDRAKLRGAIARRWPGVEERKEQYVKALDLALRWALESQDQRAVNGCIRTLTTMEAQNQSDEQMNIKYARADAGLPEETIILRASLDE
jgi:hypothetical protein